MEKHFSLFSCQTGLNISQHRILVKLIIWHVAKHCGVVSGTLHKIHGLTRMMVSGSWLLVWFDIFVYGPCGFSVGKPTLGLTDIVASKGKGRVDSCGQTCVEPLWANTYCGPFVRISPRWVDHRKPSQGPKRANLLQGAMWAFPGQAHDLGLSTTGVPKGEGHPSGISVLFYPVYSEPTTIYCMQEL